MVDAYLFIISIGVVFVVMYFVFLSDKNNHETMMKKQEQLIWQINALSQKILHYENSVSTYRDNNTKMAESYSDAQDHLAKLRDEVLRHRKILRSLRSSMVKRVELSLRPNFKDQFKKIASQLDELS